MRRFALAAIGVLGLVLLPLTSAYADPSPAASIPVPTATPGQSVCKVDEDLHSLSGLTATANGYAVVDRADTSGLVMRVYQLDSKCQRISPSLKYSGSGPRDPRDIQLSTDGKDYWVADTGDDLQTPDRPTIALWKVPVDPDDSATLYHFSFPDGDGPWNVDAMLMGSSGSPVFVTHPLSGAAGIYVPTAAPGSSTVPLRKVGQFTPQRTGTPNKLGPDTASAVTGGAVSPDGKKVVLRTYSDAYEWDVTNGDIVKALTTGTPRITPLENEDQGEAITYSHDGKYFLTVQDLSTGNQTTMLRYTPSTLVPIAKPASTGGSGGSGGKSWFSSLSFDQVTALVGVVGVIGLGMLAAGIVGIVRFRKRQPTAAPAGELDVDEGRARPQEVLAGAASVPARDGRPPRDRGRPGGAVYGAGGTARAPEDGYLNAGAGGRPGGSPPPRGRSAPPPAGGTYRAGGDGPRDGDRSGGTYRGGGDAPRDGDRSGGTYRGGGDGPRDGDRSGGTYRGGSPSGADRAGRDRGGRDGGGRDRGGRDRGGRDGGGADRGSGTYSGGTYSSGGFEPPAAASPPPPRTGGGIARSHRPERRGSHGAAPPPPRRGGYAEEHDGFDDLRRLSEE
ncbi:hypothetical protein GCM10023322_16690 [Rugosimonospora acidiphila]|uniref:WD40-like Beta Propeller Repeat n=1 Tax=Rugosimonospora acidiphila TaxID=556531 RepID=A0ABP9RPA4_9ACTN